MKTIEIHQVFNIVAKNCRISTLGAVNATLGATILLTGSSFGYFGLTVALADLTVRTYRHYANCNAYRIEQNPGGSDPVRRCSSLFVE